MLPSGRRQRQILVPPLFAAEATSRANVSAAERRSLVNVIGALRTDEALAHSPDNFLICRGSTNTANGV